MEYTLRIFLITFLTALLPISACAVPPSVCGHLSGWDDYYVGRSIPGLVAARWSGHQHLGQAAILDLKHVGNDTSTIQQVLARFNRDDEVDYDVIRISNPFTAAYAVVDLNGDGNLDLLIDPEDERATLIWSPGLQDWQRTELPTAMDVIGGRLLVVREDGAPSLIIRSISQIGAWHFVDGQWQSDSSLIDGLEIDGVRVLTSAGGRDRGVRFRDLDGDGLDELIVANQQQRAILKWSRAKRAWQQSSMAWPPEVLIATDDGRDAGVRFADVNGDSHVDLLVSNEERSAIYLYQSAKDGFARALLQAERSQNRDELFPPFAVDGQPTSVWFDDHTRSVLRAQDRREAEPSMSWNRMLRFAVAFEDVISGFQRLEHNDGEESVWWDYRGEKSPNHVVRQEKKGARLTWQTATVPEGSLGDRLTFLFVGGLGYQSEPATDGFALSVDGKSNIAFDLTRETTTWAANDEKAKLEFHPTWQSGSDVAGFFRLTVDRSELSPGEPLSLTVTSLGEGSRRWFAIHPVIHPVPMLADNPQQ